MVSLTLTSILWTLPSPPLLSRPFSSTLCLHASLQLQESPMLFLALGLGQAFPTASTRVHFPCPTAHESHLSSFRGHLRNGFLLEISPDSHWSVWVKSNFYLLPLHPELFLPKHISSCFLTLICLSFPLDLSCHECRDYV